MDFDFSAQQKAFREAVASTLDREIDREVLFDLVDDEAGVTDRLWSVGVDQGWPALLVPEESGGIGGTLVDSIVLMEEMGRIPLPGPFFSSGVLATLAARRLGADDLLADLAAGERRGTVALGAAGPGDPLDGVATTASEDGDSWRLDGIEPVVLDGHTADWVIVAARDGGQVGAFLVENPDAEAVPAMDPTRKIARLVLDGTPAQRLGNGDVTGVLQRVVDDAAVALCAELVGASEAALDVAVEYSRNREQFGRPIGAFQVIKHMAADMLQKVELARVGVHYAAWTSDEDTPDRAQSVALAKSWTAEAAIEVTGDSIQIHGAVGFTWEAMPHLYYKRAKVNDLLLGQQGWQRQRVADAVLGPVAAPA